MLNIKDFCEYVRGNLPKYLTEYPSCKVEIDVSKKVNDTEVYALVARMGNAVPRMDLNGFYSEYVYSDESEDFWVEKIAREYMHAMEGVPKISTDTFKSFEKCKDLIYPRLLNTELNKEYLADKISTEITDLSVVYAVTAVKDAGYIVITRDMADSWGVTPEEIHQAAIKNADEGVLVDMSSLTAMIGAPEIKAPKMYVITYKNMPYGAGALVSKEIQKQAEELLGERFVIIPSSVDEVIILPEEMAGTRLTKMIQDVNGSEVPVDKVLSNHPYIYEKGRIMAA